MDKEYNSDDIQAHSSREHVRKRPRMFFEKCFSEQSLDSLPFEVLCHAFDEYHEGNCKEIKITFWKDYFSVVYDVGMPLRKLENGDLSYAEVIMTQLMACSNLKNHLAVGDEFCAMGMATINFVSEHCELTSLWNNKKGVFLFKKGERISGKIIDHPSHKSWTKIVVTPDRTIFENMVFTSKGITEKANILKQRLVGLNIIIENKINDNGNR